jgi:hypothetical protein
MYKNDRRFKHLRFFLLASVILSITLPMSTFRAKLDSSFIRHETQRYLPDVSKIPSLKINRVDLLVLSVDPTMNQQETDYSYLFIKIYFIVSIALIARIIVQIANLFVRYFRSKKQKQG